MYLKNLIDSLHKSYAPVRRVMYKCVVSKYGAQIFLLLKP